MKKLVEYIKTSKTASKILMGVWMFFVGIITLGCIASEKGETAIDDIFFLLFMYVIFSSMFLIPAITINQSAKGKINVLDPSKSKSTWITTFLLCLFLGHLGAHRFYTGKKFTGVVYIFTMGGFGLASLTDLILVIMGKYTDKNGFFIKYKTKNQFEEVDVSTNGNKRIVDTETHSLNFDIAKNTFDKLKSEANQKKEKWLNDGKEKLNQWRNDSNNGFSDVILEGGEEKTQSIPSINVDSSRKASTIHSGLTISIKPVISRDETGNYMLGDNIY